jgi:hypothetical protein
MHEDWFVHDPMFALVPLPPNPGVARARDRDERTPRWLLPGAAGAGALSIVLFLAGLPLLSMCLMAVTCIAGIALPLPFMLRRLHGDDIVAPEQIASPEARTIYRSILGAFDEVDRAFARAPRLQSSAAPVLERCRAAVAMCGRIAYLANPVQRYLELHDPQYARAELARLRARTEATTDASTSAALGHATAARARQVAAHDEMLAMRDRVNARLELVRAALESFAAMVVKLEFAEDEQIAQAGGSVVEQLAGINDELAVIESALAVDLAA